MASNVRRNVKGRVVMPDPVLLVEDKGALREMFSGALASAGCRVSVGTG